MTQKILAGVGGVVLEGSAVWLFFKSENPAASYAAHAAASVLLANCAARMADRVNSLPGAGTWLFGVMLPVPALGPLCAAGLLAIMLLLPDRSKSDVGLVIGVPGSEASDLPPGLRARSIIEVLASPDTLARRDAVLSLRSEISSSAVLILQKAVGDSDEQVRNYSQSQLAKWTEQAELDIKRLTAQAAAPEAPPEVFLALAESLHKMVAFHLAGPELEKKYLLLATSWLERIPARSPGRGNADLLAVHCALRLRQPARAREVFDRLTASGYAHESLDSLRLRILFHERDWHGLRAELGRARSEVPPEIDQSRKFWDAPPVSA